jgi:hypothetical protein
MRSIHVGLADTDTAMTWASSAVTASVAKLHGCFAGEATVLLLHGAAAFV